MADPKTTSNPVTVHFIDTAPAVSQSVPVTASNPLPVTIAGGGADADVNLAAVNGATSTAFGSGAIGTGTQRVTLATDSPGIVTLGQAAMAASVPVAIASNQTAVPVTASLAAAATGGYTANNITTSTTTVVKSGAGTLHGINVNTLGTVASTAVVYDNTAGSGTKLATIDTLTVGNVGWNQYDVAFATGLTIVTTGAPDITVSYK